MIIIIVSIVVTSFLIAITANLNGKMDKMMVDYMNLTDNQKTLDYYKQNTPSWYSFDWRAKYENFNNGIRAYNKLFLKIGKRTRWLADNCNDAWHFYKSTIIVLVILAIALQAIFCFFYQIKLSNLLFLKCGEFIFYGYLWNAIFNKQFNHK